MSISTNFRKAFRGASASLGYLGWPPKPFEKYWYIGSLIKAIRENMKYPRGLPSYSLFCFRLPRLPSARRYGEILASADRPRSLPLRLARTLSSVHMPWVCLQHKASNSNHMFQLSENLSFPEHSAKKRFRGASTSFRVHRKTSFWDTNWRRYGRPTFITDLANFSLLKRRRSTLKA